jgi:transcriptional regulator with XRE-family HTH domain
MANQALIDFGRRVRDRRLALGVLQDDLANAIGVSRPIIGKIERGERESLPSREQIAKIARKLDMKPESLFGANENILERFTEEEQELLRNEQSTQYIKLALAKMVNDQKVSQEYSSKAAMQRALDSTSDPRIAAELSRKLDKPRT